MIVLEFFFENWLRAAPIELINNQLRTIKYSAAKKLIQNWKNRSFELKFIIPVLGLRGISPMAMAFPLSPPVTMYGQYLATGGQDRSRLFRIASMAIGAPLVGNPWPLIENLWPLVEIDIFQSDNLACGTFNCEKNEKKINAI